MTDAAFTEFSDCLPNASDHMARSHAPVPRGARPDSESFLSPPAFPKAPKGQHIHRTRSTSQTPLAPRALTPHTDRTPRTPTQPTLPRLPTPCPHGPRVVGDPRRRRHHHRSGVCVGLRPPQDPRPGAPSSSLFETFFAGPLVRPPSPLHSHIPHPLPSSRPPVPAVRRAPCDRRTDMVPRASGVSHHTVPSARQHRRNRSASILS